jgi:hypothetical protein
MPKRPKRIRYPARFELCGPSDQTSRLVDKRGRLPKQAPRRNETIWIAPTECIIRKRIVRKFGGRISRTLRHSAAVAGPEKDWRPIHRVEYILHSLTPVGVAMAGANEFDPYKGDVKMLRPVALKSDIPSKEIGACGDRPAVPGNEQEDMLVGAYNQDLRAVDILEDPPGRFQGF